MAKRTVKIRHDDETRAKIQVAQIINRFQSCIDGKIDLTMAQVSCGKTLLAKVLPDLQATELTGKDGGPLSIKSLLSEIEGRSRGIPTPPPEKQEEDQPGPHGPN